MQDWIAKSDEEIANGKTAADIISDDFDDADEEFTLQWFGRNTYPTSLQTLKDRRK